MKTVNSFLLFLVIILTVSCRVPEDPFNRPKIVPAIVNNCSGFRNGEEIDVTNFLAVDHLEYEQLQSFYEDVEFRLYICNRSRRRFK